MYQAEVNPFKNCGKTHWLLLYYPENNLQRGQTGKLWVLAPKKTIKMDCSNPSTSMKDVEKTQSKT